MLCLFPRTLDGKGAFSLGNVIFTDSSGERKMRCVLETPIVKPRSAYSSSATGDLPDRDSNPCILSIALLSTVERLHPSPNLFNKSDRHRSATQPIGWYADVENWNTRWSAQLNRAPFLLIISLALIRQHKDSACITNTITHPKDGLESWLCLPIILDSFEMLNALCSILANN